MNTEPHNVIIPGLLTPTIEIIDPELGELKSLLVWKRVRPTSTALYALLQDNGILALGRKRVLNAVAAIRNATQRWPTACEIQKWLASKGQIPNDGNPNHVRPRLTELSSGWSQQIVRAEDGKRIRVKRWVPCDVLVRGDKRPSDVTGITVLTWRVREFSE